jgi:hypothetical protein
MGSLEWRQKLMAKHEVGRRRWALLRGNKTAREQGLQLMRQEYAQDPNGISGVELGVALLWLGLYSEAHELFCSRIETDRTSIDSDYGMAGVSVWCLGQPWEAASYWHAGLKAPYARCAGLGIRIPLLLFFASVVRPEVFGQNEARKLLREKLRDPRIKTWPGAIAKFVTGKIGEAELTKSCQSTNKSDASTRQWLSDFYRNVIGHERMTHFAFMDFMHKLADTSQPWWREKDTFTSRLWHEEFFLARHLGAKRESGKAD